MEYRYFLPLSNSTIFIAEGRQDVWDEDRHREFSGPREAFVVMVHRLLPFPWQCFCELCGFSCFLDFQLLQ